MADMYGEPDDGELTNTEKAAILLIALGPEYSAKIFQHLDDDEIERITLEIANAVSSMRRACSRRRSVPRRLWTS